MPHLTQQRMFTDTHNTITVAYEGNHYRIVCDSSRPGRNSPKWYVQRESDWSFSKRYYTYPEGAFSALTWGRISWIK